MNVVDVVDEVEPALSLVSRDPEVVAVSLTCINVDFCAASQGGHML